MLFVQEAKIDRRLARRWRRRQRPESSQPSSSGFRPHVGKLGEPVPLHEAIERLEAAVGRLLLAIDEEGISSSTATEMAELLKTRLYDVQQGRRYVSEIRRAGEPALWVLDTVT